MNFPVKKLGVPGIIVAEVIGPDCRIGVPVASDPVVEAWAVEEGGGPDLKLQLFWEVGELWEGRQECHAGECG